MNNNFKKGFTLIELIVVLAVFLLIIGVAISIFISIFQNQKRILAEQRVLNQVSYVEEYMSKALRMAAKDTDGLACFGDIKYQGYNYLLTNPNPTTGFYEGIKFINATDNDACEEFFLDSGVLKKKEYVGLSASTAVALTSTELQINSIRFGIDETTGCVGAPETCPPGALKQDGTKPQSRVTISLGVKVPNDTQEPIKYIQTTISQRNLNAEP